MNLDKSLSAFAALLFLPLLLSSQALDFTIGQEVVAEPGLKAIMVSNQYGVLRYFSFANKLDKDKDFSFNVRQRRGEELALTLVREVEERGIYSFRNTTYTQLSDGAKIVAALAKKEDAPTAYRSLEINIAGIDGVEDFILWGPQGRQAEYRVNRGSLNVNASLAESTGIFAMMRLPGEKGFRHFCSPMTADNRFELYRESLGQTVFMGRVAMPYSAEWKGAIKGMKDGQPYYLYNSTQQLAGESDTVAYLIPSGMNFDSLTLSLSAMDNKGTALYGSYPSNLPNRLDTFAFETNFSSSESKGFTFSLAEDESDYFVVSYYYSTGPNRPLPSWHVWGATEGRDSIDFIMPDLPEELFEMIPELQEVAAPIAIDKNGFRCTQNCEAYDYSKHPALLEDNTWRMHYGLIARRQLLRIE